MNISEEQMLGAVEERAREIAQLRVVPKRYVEQAIWAAVIDMLVTEDSELNEKIDDHLMWILSVEYRGEDDG